MVYLGLPQGSVADDRLAVPNRVVCRRHTRQLVGGEVRIHQENARMSGRHGVQYVAQCVACAALTLVVWKHITNLSIRQLIRVARSKLRRRQDFVPRVGRSHC